MDTNSEKKRATSAYDDVDYLNFGKKNTGTAKTKQSITPAIMSLDEVDIEPIQVEQAPVDFMRHDSIMLALLKRRVTKTLETGVQVGQAFPVPAKSKHSISEFLKKEYPDMRFRVSHPKGQPFARMIRMA